MTATPHTALAALTLLAVLAPAPQPGSDWLVSRGDPLQSGVARAKLPEKLEVLWTFKATDIIEGAPAVAGGVVYFGSFDENLYAVDLNSGKGKWRYKGGPFKAAAAVHKDAVYIGDQNGLFHCVDAASGKKRWTFETAAEIASGANFAGDLILFGSHDENLYCLTPDGKEKWRVKTEGPVNGSPVVAGKHTFVAGCDGSVHVIELEGGKEVAAIDLDGQAAATAAVIGDFLYVGTMTNRVQGVDWKNAKRVWTFEPARRAQPFYAPVSATDRLIIAGSRDKHVYALDRRSGEEVWNFATDGRIDAAPVVVGDRVFVGSLDGKLYTLDLASGRELARLKLDGPITGSPAVVEGRLLIGTEKGTLYCLGAKK
jgi:outer membrane protein assembly factor BamB